MRALTALSIAATLLAAGCAASDDPPATEGNASDPADDQQETAADADSVPERTPDTPDDTGEGDTVRDPADTDRVETDAPPKVSIRIEGSTATMARGGSCWTDGAGDRTCADPFGVVTDHEVHAFAPGAQATFALDPDITPTRVAATLLQPTSDPEERGAVLVWPSTDTARIFDLDTLDQVTLDADPGHYLFELRLGFDQDGASYAIQIELKATGNEHQSSAQA